MTHDPYRALPGLAKTLKDMDASLRGRMATVERVDGHMVTVTTPGSAGVSGMYPATVSGLAVGDVGVLLPLRGTNALFIPVGWEGETQPLGAVWFSTPLPVEGYHGSVRALGESCAGCRSREGVRGSS